MEALAVVSIMSVAVRHLTDMKYLYRTHRAAKHSMQRRRLAKVSCMVMV